MYLPGQVRVDGQPHSAACTAGARHVGVQTPRGRTPGGRKGRRKICACQLEARALARAAVAAAAAACAYTWRLLYRPSMFSQQAVQQTPTGWQQHPLRNPAQMDDNECMTRSA